MSDWNEAVEKAAKLADEQTAIFDKLCSNSDDEHQRDRLAARSRASSNIAAEIRSLKRPSVSDGGEWQLVPKEPTVDMLHAWEGVLGKRKHSFRELWDALLSAAPTALKPPVGE